LEVAGKHYRYFSLNELKDERLAKLPYSVRVLLEAAIRNCDNFNVKRKILRINFI
jgi:aconitate hydratase